MVKKASRELKRIREKAEQLHAIEEISPGVKDTVLKMVGESTTAEKREEGTREALEILRQGVTGKNKKILTWTLKNVATTSVARDIVRDVKHQTIEYRKYAPDVRIKKLEELKETMKEKMENGIATLKSMNIPSNEKTQREALNQAFVLIDREMGQVKKEKRPKKVKPLITLGQFQANKISREFFKGYLGSAEVNQIIKKIGKDVKTIYPETSKLILKRAKDADIPKNIVVPLLEDGRGRELSKEERNLFE